MRLIPAAALLAFIVPAAPALAAGGFAIAQPISPSLTLAGKTIVVDPGHGGWDTGTVDFGYQEKDITLFMAKQLETTLRGRGAQVVMTRTTDTALGPTANADLQGRIEVAQRAHADTFVSVHANSFTDPEVTGATTYYGPACGYNSGITESPAQVGRAYALASHVESDLVTNTKEDARGARDEAFWVLGDPGVPSILVETGFLSDGAEALKLANGAYEGRVVAGIANGITDFFLSGDASASPSAPADALEPC